MEKIIFVQSMLLGSVWESTTSLCMDYTFLLMLIIHKAITCELTEKYGFRKLAFHEYKCYTRKKDYQWD